MGVSQLLKFIICTCLAFKYHMKNKRLVNKAVDYPLPKQINTLIFRAIFHLNSSSTARRGQTVLHYNRSDPMGATIPIHFWWCWEEWQIPLSQKLCLSSYDSYTLPPKLPHFHSGFLRATQPKSPWRKSPILIGQGANEYD